MPPRRLQPIIPLDLETICLKCLQKNPERRYASAKALADDLQRFLNGETITARPEGSIERTVRWIKRRPMATALIAVSAVASFISLVLSVQLWQTNQAHKNALEAERTTHASGLVKQLIVAKIADVPRIVAEIDEYRTWADPLHREEHGKAAIDSQPKLHLSLALLPVDVGQLEYLTGRLLNAGAE